MSDRVVLVPDGTGFALFSGEWLVQGMEPGSIPASGKCFPVQRLVGLCVGTNCSPMDAFGASFVDSRCSGWRFVLSLHGRAVDYQFMG